jgi:hypothetical protein
MTTTKTVAYDTITSTGKFSVPQLKTWQNNTQEATTFPSEEMHSCYIPSEMADPITFHVALQ